MSHFEISCPTCQKRLKLAVEHSGKNVRCPGCQNIFQATAPAADPPLAGRKTPEKAEQPSAPPQPRRARIVSSGESPAKPAAGSSETKRPSGGKRSSQTRKGAGAAAAGSAGYDEETDWTEDTSDSWMTDESAYDDPYADPYSTQQQPQRRKKASSQAAKGILSFLLIWLIAFGVILGVGAGGYFLYRNLPDLGGGNFVDLDYLPQNVDAVVHVRLAEILRAPVLDTLRQKNPAAFNNGMTNVIQPEDVESLTIGVWEAGSGGAQVQVPGPAALLAGGGSVPGWIAVARCSRAVNPGGAGLSIAEKYNGVDLYRDADNTYHWFADTYTVVMGGAAEIKACVDRNGKEFRQTKFDFAPSSGQVVIAAVGMKSQGAGTSALPGSPMANAAQLQNLVQSNVDRWGMSLGISSSISIDLGLNCKSGSGAQQIQTEIQNLLGQGRSQLNQLASSPFAAAPQLQTVVKLGGELLDSIKVSQSGTTVSLSAAVQKSQIDQIAGLADSMSGPGSLMRPPGM
ncbi:MAG: hypothetical protein JNM43_28170 [Planctomycetaceae bacterium]|nr:hypothetical protein [Planctomycetaceae bacterium]